MGNRLFRGFRKSNENGFISLATDEVARTQQLDEHVDDEVKCAVDRHGSVFAAQLIDIGKHDSPHGKGPAVSARNLNSFICQQPEFARGKCAMTPVEMVCDVEVGNAAVAERS